jgi:hypothetical protein
MVRSSISYSGCHPLSPAVPTQTATHYHQGTSAWLGRESHIPKVAHVMTGETDLAAARKDRIAAARERK